MKRPLYGCAGLIVGAVSLLALEIKLPDETARLAESPLPGYSLAVTYCYTCHSTDYMSYQPPMSRTAWKASVVKMQKTFGAAIPDSAVEPIAEYLAKTYGAERAVGSGAQKAGRGDK
jgi:hypothetical protein